MFHNSRKRKNDKNPYKNISHSFKFKVKKSKVVQICTIYRIPLEGPTVLSPA